MKQNVLCFTLIAFVQIILFRDYIHYLDRHGRIKIIRNKTRFYLLIPTVKYKNKDILIKYQLNLPFGSILPAC